MWRDWVWEVLDTAPVPSVPLRSVLEALDLLPALPAAAASTDLNRVRDAVLSEFLKCGGGNAGLSIRAVSAALKGRVSQDQVAAAVRVLSAEGHMSSLDEEHFASTA